MQLHRGSHTIQTRATSSPQARTRDVPLISIITVVLNAADTLERTILSVLRQDFDDLEYVIIDGGSTDGSTDILKKYSSRLASWRSQPDEGQGAAINEGMSRATGEILAYLNSDDLLLPGAVSRLSGDFTAKVCRAC